MVPDLQIKCSEKTPRSGLNDSVCVVAILRRSVLWNEVLDTTTLPHTFPSSHQSLLVVSNFLDVETAASSLPDRPLPITVLLNAGIEKSG